jgi:outer membrane protein, heavy metal efflux system
MKTKQLLLRTLMVLGLLLTFSAAAAAESAPPPLTLEPLIREALEKNPEIAAVEGKSRIYRERIPQASALEDPMVSFGIVNLPTSLNFREDEMTMKEVSISQRFPFPGKRGLMHQMAEKESESIDFEVAAKMDQIVRDVSTAFYDLSHAHEAIGVTQSNKEILEGFAKIAESRYAVGEGIQQDIIKARVEISKMVDELAMLEQQKKAFTARLNVLLGRPPLGRLDMPEEIEPGKFPFTEEMLLEMALITSPALLGAERMIEARRKGHELARKEYYPDFGVRFSYGQRDRSPDPMAMERRDMVSGMVEMNIPLYRRSKQDRKVAEALAGIAVAQAEYGAMKNEISYMISELTSMIRLIETQLELYKTGIIPQARLQLDSALGAYRVNRADFMTLLDSRMTLFNYELEYHRTISQYYKTTASLGAVVGKFFFPKEGT